MSTPPLSLVKAWTAARHTLEAAGVDTPVIDARLMLLAASGLDRITLISDPHRPLDPEAAERLEGWVARRAAREPVAHIIGRRGFWTLDLISDRRALVPRPETEVIVDVMLKSMPDAGPLKVLDLGTGSGAILLALLAERPDWTGLGIDISPPALDLARENAALHGLEGRARFAEGDWADGLDGHWDMVVSNPPYIPSDDIAGLMADVRDHDPHLALDGGPDGLAPYRLLFAALPRLLNSGGMFAFEFGESQGEALRALALEVPGLVNVTILKDLSDRERVIVGRSAF